MYCGQGDGFCPKPEVEYKRIVGGSGGSTTVAVVVIVVTNMTTTPFGLAWAYAVCGLV